MKKGMPIYKMEQINWEIFFRNFNTFFSQNYFTITCLQAKLLHKNLKQGS